MTENTPTGYAMQGVGDCLGAHQGGAFSVMPTEEIQPGDIALVVPREGTLIATLLKDDLDALGKIFLGRTDQAVRLATLNPPEVIDLPLDEIHALHRLASARLAPEELAHLAQFSTGQPIKSINPEWRPRGCVGLSRLTGEMMTRYASRTLWGAALGPSAELLETAFTQPGAFLSDQWTASDTRALRKILPFQNIFYIRRLFDQVEEGANRAIGIPQRRTVVKK